MRRRLSVILAGIMLMGSAAFAPVKADNDPEPTQITRLSSTSRKVRIGKKFEIKAYTELREFDEDCLVWSVPKLLSLKTETGQAMIWTLLPEKPEQPIFPAGSGALT